MEVKHVLLSFEEHYLGVCMSLGWFAAQWLIVREWPPLAEVIGPTLKQQSTYSNWAFTNLPNGDQAGCRRWPSDCSQPKGKPPWQHAIGRYIIFIGSSLGIYVSLCHLYKHQHLIFVHISIFLKTDIGFWRLKIQTLVSERFGGSKPGGESAHRAPRCLAQPWTQDALHG